MFIPGAIDVIGTGVGRGLGVIVMPGIGAGVLFLGAGVDIGMPGIGAMVGCAATPGDAVTTIENAATTTKRKASKGTSGATIRVYYVP